MADKQMFPFQQEKQQIRRQLPNILWYEVLMKKE